MLASWEDEQALGTCEEEEEGTSIPEGLKIGVDEGFTADNDSALTCGEVYAGAALLLSSSSCVNSASIRRISVEEDGVTFISLAGSWGTPARRHNSSQVDSPPGHDRTKASRLRKMQNGLVLGWYDSAADESKPIPGGDVNIPLLNRSSRTQPPRGDIRNHLS
ncbi:hypothetical protein H5410_003416 [Solanum commersonii]|uniref:Uncharacterized protein n=1 Tax=Solanum commersonii TaxID=4109 RepID=A0A9J6B503_SOLCO|nr:hypothetical protein H5410_003416 [Solanum commersonii]